MSNIIVDQDQQWLLNCLTATLDPNHEVRSFAEASLSQACLQPVWIFVGFCFLNVVVCENLAAVILKQFIKEHWQEDGENFEHPVVTSEEKAVICNLLLLSLDDPHAKIRTAIAMAVASIAQYDWPEDWQELLPFLLKMIACHTSMSGVCGAVKCLNLLCDDLDDISVPGLVPVLFPCLHTIISSPQAETSSLIIPMLKSCTEQIAMVLEGPVQLGDAEDWSIKMEVLKCLMQFVQNFPNHIEAEFSGTLTHSTRLNFIYVSILLMFLSASRVIEAPLWQTFVTSLKVYEISSIQGTNDPYSGNYDSEGEEKSLEAFIIQLFEFLLTLVGSSRFVKVITKNVKELIYYIIAFMQMTEQQVHMWSSDANQYVADEDDGTYNCRASGKQL
ncbi:hypothetical protein IFM89_000477 [Coptis chinensis]|uniref:Importin N-terminal domain-containing protein n=1 Tax=Coptis chinensis TaxID=261450 RepID=A0A835LFU8_9MAGN|nr:hypothetical protein IFM89_000477 [Coptis chinensis]